MNKTGTGYNHFGTVVEPIRGTLRRVAGGRCVDVRVNDPRSTITHATVNADNVVDENGQRYQETV